MKCHACGKRMKRDQWGNPVHWGSEVCPGYPVAWTADFVGCEHCGSDVTRAKLVEHHVTCTADDPRPVNRRNRRCPMCSLWHRPNCWHTEAPRWPRKPLEAWFVGADTKQDICDALDVFQDKWDAWKYRGISDMAADHAACTIGVHPALIWPEWFDKGLTVMDRAKAEHRAWRHMWLADETKPGDQDAAA